MSAEHALAALRNIVASGSRFLLASHYPHASNEDIDVVAAVSTSYRCYNLTAKPFDKQLGEPELIFEDEYDTQRRNAAGGGRRNAMHLALWRLGDS